MIVFNPAVVMAKLCARLSGTITLVPACLRRRRVKPGRDARSSIAMSTEKEVEAIVKSEYTSLEE